MTGNIIPQIYVPLKEAKETKLRYAAACGSVPPPGGDPSPLNDLGKLSKNKHKNMEKVYQNKHKIYMGSEKISNNITTKAKEALKYLKKHH